MTDQTKIPDLADLLPKGKIGTVYLVYGADGMLLDVALSKQAADEVLADEDDGAHVNGAYIDTWTCGA